MNDFTDLAPDMKVILVLGETGAGKTTWMNTLPNYL
jgi:type IV secretory pathway ATPase VirB11/archaellum biosynthesis ATPase